MKNLCKHFSGGGNFKHPVTSSTKGTLLSLLLIACTTFTACNDEEALPIAGKQLQLSFGVNAPESRAIFTDTKLPDNSPVGVRLDGYTDYANLVYTGSTTSGTQSWSSTTSVTLTDTKGTLYAYWPQNNAVSIDAIDVDMTAADQTDWLYATPVTDVNEDKASVAVTMNHALANINVTVNKGTYKGDGNITNITVQSDGIALGGTFNAAKATPAYESFENEGKPLFRTVTTTAGAAATDIMVVPTGTSAAITFLLTIDDIQFTAKSDAVQLTMGNSYQYTLNLSDISTYMEISTFAVKPWVTIMDSNPIQLDKYDPYKDYVQVIYNVENTGTKTSLLSSPGVTHYYNNVPYTFSLATVEEMIVDGQSVEPTTSYTFESAGYHKVCYKFKNNTIPDVCFKQHTNIIDIKLPDNIVGLGSVALAECTGLTEITIPESVTRIGDYTFDECTGLTDITIPNSVTSIGQYAFGGCSGVKTITLGAGLTGIGSYAFSELGALRIIKLLATTAPSIRNNTFKTVRSGGLFIVPSGCTDAYATWMSTSSYYLGYNNWVCLEEDNYVFEDGIYYSADGKTILANDGSLSGAVSIKEGVEIIGNYAFYQCNNISSVNIPNSVTAIGNFSFRDCTGLKEVTIPNSVASIGNTAFYGCTNMTEVTIGSGIQSFGSNIFSSCTNLSKITSLLSALPTDCTDAIGNVKEGGVVIIPAGSTDKYADWQSLMDKNWEFIEADSYIYENGIYYSPDGKTILANDGSLSGLLSIKNGVTHIEANAFANCDNITDIVMPESVISIGENAFIGCDGLVTVNLGNGVSTIGNYAFKNCTGLTTLDLGTELQTIGAHAFYRCTGLIEVTIPNSVTSIGSEAFRYCSNIKKLTIGTGLNKIPEYSLGDMKSLDEVHILNPKMPTGFAGAFTNAPLNVLLFVPNGSKSSYSSMYEYNSCYWICLEEGNYVLENGIYYSADGKTILANDGSLSGTLSIKEGVEIIGNYAFRACSELTEITIPNSVNTIGKQAIAYCTNLGKITSLATTAPTIQSNTFQGAKSNGILYVSSGCKEAYTSWVSTSSYYLGYYNWICLPNDAVLENGIYYSADGKTVYGYDVSYTETLSIKEGVSHIYDYAFRNCKNSIGELILPNSVNTIGKQAFDGCTGLTEVTIPNSVTSIEYGTFYDCTGLKEVNIGKGVTMIGNYAFYQCSGLTGELKLPESLTSIGQSAFYGCKGLTEVTIPNLVTSIGAQAFYECGNLVEITSLATTAPSITSNTFYYVKANGRLFIPKGTTESYATWMSTSSYYLGYNNWVCLEEGNYIFEDGIYYSADGKTILANDGSLSGTLSIKEGVETIGDYAFYKCSGLTQVIIPNSVTSIGRAAFYECRGLTGELIIPNLVTDIGQSAFSGCAGLTVIKLPDSLTSIGKYAFNSCTGLTEVTIPNSVTNIGSNAFSYCNKLTGLHLGTGVKTIGDNAFSSCYKLISITSLATIAPSIQSSTFTSVKSGGTLIVPSGCTDAYASWMSTGNYYLGKYNWTIQEMTE